ncbi:hypothetical protein [Haemophilus influenzae]
MEPQPSINRLEKAIVDKNYEVACSELLNILEKIDGNFGGIIYKNTLIIKQKKIPSVGLAGVKNGNI